MKRLVVIALLATTALGRIGYGADNEVYRAQATQALAQGDTQEATDIALEWLKEKAPASLPLDRRDGNVIHDANQILGLAALGEKRIDDAKGYLIAAGKTHGSPRLESFGPKMLLAKALLDRGERGVVIRYLDLVAKFWAGLPSIEMAKIENRNPQLAVELKEMFREHQALLNSWKTQIRAGETPELNGTQLFLFSNSSG